MLIYSQSNDRNDILQFFTVVILKTCEYCTHLGKSFFILFFQVSSFSPFSVRS